MTNLFYFLAIFAIMWEGYVSFYTEQALNLERRCEDHEKNPSIRSLGMFMFLYSLWTFIGLIFSSQWIWFLAIFAMSFLKKDTVVIKRIDAYVTLALLFFILINRYHLHIKIL